MKQILGVLSILLGILIFILEKHFLYNGFRSLLKPTSGFWFFDNFISLGILCLACLIPILFAWTGIGLLRNKDVKIPGFFLGIVVLMSIVVVLTFAYTIANA